MPLNDSQIMTTMQTPTPQYQMDPIPGGHILHRPAREIADERAWEADRRGRTTFAAPLAPVAPVRRGRLARTALWLHDLASGFFRLFRKPSPELPPNRPRTYKHQSGCLFTAAVDMGLQGMGWIPIIIHADGGVERTLMRRPTEADALQAACDLLDARDRNAYEARKRG